MVRKDAASGCVRSVSLVEMIAVAVVLGVFALIVAPNVVGTIGGSKLAALGTTLSELQGGSDHFYALTDAYPTYAGSAVQNQPAACPDAYEVSAKAVDASGTTFVAGYVHEAPQSSAATAGLPSGAGSTVYYGITSTGQVIATQAVPDTNGDEWTLAGTPVYTPANLSTPTTLGLLCAGQSPNTASVTENLTLSGSNITVSGTAPAGSTVTATSTDPVTASATASSSGAYSITLSDAWASGNPSLVTVVGGGGALAYGYVDGDGSISMVTPQGSTPAPPSAVDSLQLTGPAMDPVAGTPFQVSLTKVKGGTTDASYNGTDPISVTLGSPDSGATLPTSADFVQGIATVPITLSVAQSPQTITVTDGRVTSNSATVAVVVAAVPSGQYAVTNVSASSYCGSNAPAAAFDGNTSTAWCADGNTGWIQAELASPGSVSAIRIDPGTSVPGSDTDNVTLYGSTDGTNWTAIQSWSPTVTDGTWYTLSLNAPATGYTWLRLGSTFSTDWVVYFEIQFCQ